MTADITELAQREKFEAWLSDKPFHARYMHWSNTLNAYDYTGIQLAWEAYQAGGAELVEALEKAQAKNALVAGGIEATAKLHECIAELESRTVTVKLPEPPGPMSIGARTVYFGIVADVVRSFQDGLAAAGIKVEAE